jgi:hypothetical protein
MDILQNYVIIKSGAQIMQNEWIDWQTKSAEEILKQVQADMDDWKARTQRKRFCGWFREKEALIPMTWIPGKSKSMLDRTSEHFSLTPGSDVIYYYKYNEKKQRRIKEVLPLDIKNIEIIKLFYTSYLQCVDSHFRSLEEETSLPENRSGWTPLPDAKILQRTKAALQAWKKQTQIFNLSGVTLDPPFRVRIKRKLINENGHFLFKNFFQDACYYAFAQGSDKVTRVLQFSPEEMPQKKILKIDQEHLEDVKDLYYNLMGSVRDLGFKEADLFPPEKSESQDTELGY